MVGATKGNEEQSTELQGSFVSSDFRVPGVVVWIKSRLRFPLGQTQHLLTELIF